MILLWRVSTRCNYACGFCAYDRRLAMPRRAIGRAEAERVALIAADVARQRGEQLLLSWLGGEPMLWPPLLDLYEKLARHPAITLCMTSNGTRLDKVDVRQRVLSAFAELTLSLDGPAMVHDRLRGVSGSFALVRAAIVALVAERRALDGQIKLRVNVVLMRSTLPHFADLCAMLADWGVDEITFNQLGGRDRPDFFPDQRLSSADAARLAGMIVSLRSALAQRGVRLCASQDYLARIAASSASVPCAVADCRPGESFLFADELGRIGPCSFTLDQYGVDLADVRTPANFATLARRFRENRAAVPAQTCADCPSTQQFGKFAA